MFLKKHIHQQLVFLFLILFSFKTNAQRVRTIDNKGTIKIANKNKVFLNNQDPNTPPESADKRAEGDIWYNSDTKITKVWDIYTDTSGTLQGKWEELIGAPIHPNIHTISTDTTLTDEHHTIIIDGAPSSGFVTLTLPNPTDPNYIGKVYRIKNNYNSNAIIVPNWIDADGSSKNSMGWTDTYIIQSDGVSWQRINNP